MSISTNNQPGVAGLGWDLSVGYIERRYMPCNDPKEGGSVADQCWVSDNATITFGGRSSELVEVTDHNPPRSTPAGATEWRLEIDPRWRILRWSGANNGDQGDAGTGGEWWQVFMPDGTVATFGRGNITNNGQTFDHESALTVPVVGNSSGEPCYGANAQHWCQQGWRWMVDTVTDSNGNTQSYFWHKEQNRYQTLGGTISPQSYDMAARLWRVEYGETASNLWTNNDVGVDFEYGYRCISLNDTCTTPPDGSNGADFPDVPNDLICTSATSCDDPSPSFFTAYRLRAATTWIRESDVYTDANRVQFSYDWTCKPYSGNNGICGTPEVPDDPNTPEDDDPVDDLATKLWLREIQRIGSPVNTSGDHNNPVWQLDPLATMPPIRFDAIDTLSTDWTGEPLGSLAFPNRADFRHDSEYQMLMYRITQVRDELGGVLEVTYGQPSGCIGLDPENPDAAQDLPASGFVDNYSNCYPVWTSAAAPGDDPGDPGGPTGWALFNKYVVTKTRVIDMTPDGGTFVDYDGETVTSITRYNYSWGINDAGGQAPGWGYSDVTWVPRHRNWNVWHGYSEVAVRVGNDNDPDPLLSRHRYFRGMNGDHVPTWHTADGTRDVLYDRIATEPDALAGPTRKIADDEWFQGYERESRSMRAGANPLLFNDGTDETSTVNLPAAVETATTGTGVARAVYTQQTSTFTQPLVTSQQRASAGYVSQTTTATTYDNDGYPATVTTSGTDVATTCVKYAYARNQTSTTWIVDRVKSELTFPTVCPTISTTAGVVKETYRYYDGNNSNPGFDVPPTKGNVTWERIATGDPDPNKAYLGTVTEYDDYGRVKMVQDPRGYQTRMQYSASDSAACSGTWSSVPGPVRKSKTTNPKNWDSCVTQNPLWGVPTAELDVRGYTINKTYDKLGRLNKVWLQNRLTTNLPDYEFTYAIAAPNYVGANPAEPQPIAGHVVTSRRLFSGSQYLATYDIVDSLGRTRQRQSGISAPGTPRIISGDSIIDGRGLTVRSWQPYASSGPLGTLAPPSARPDGPSTETDYDALGRPTESRLISRYANTPETPGGPLDPPLITETDYDGLTTIVNPPGGDSAGTSTTVDALGRTKQVVELNNAGVDAATNYTYTLRGEVETTTNAAGHVTTYGYDFAGRRTSVDDPNNDPGPAVTTLGYDANGNVTAQIDGRGQSTWTEFDELNRPLRRGAGSITPTVDARMRWFYDQYSATDRGRLSRIEQGGNFKQFAWSPQGQLVQVSNATNLGSPAPCCNSLWNAVTQQYFLNEAGELREVSYQGGGSTQYGSPQYVNTLFDTLGRPIELRTAENGFMVKLARNATYATTGPVPGARLATTFRSAGGEVTRTYSYDGYGRERGTSTTQPGSAAVAQSQTFQYNAEGLTSRIVEGGAAAQAICLGYDSRNRLDSAFTAAVASDCTGPDATGPDPLNQTFTYDSINRMSAVGSASRTWDPTRPSAIANSGTGTTYNYTDNDGRADQRTTTGGTQDLLWDSFGQLEAVHGPGCAPTGGCIDAYAYTPDGTRITQVRNDSSMTLYGDLAQLDFGATAPAVQLATYESTRVAPVPKTVTLSPINLPANSLILVSIANGSYQQPTINDSTGATWAQVSTYGAGINSTIYYRKTTTAAPGTILKLSTQLTATTGWSVHVASIANAWALAPDNSNFKNTGTTSATSDAVIGPSHEPTYARRYGMVAVAGGPNAIAPATEATELHEQSTVGYPNLQVQDGVGKVSARSLTSAQSWASVSLGIIGGSPTVRRTITFAGEPIGVVAPDGYHLTLGDRQGTSAFSVSPTGGVTIRRFTPYGAPREAAPPAWPVPNGFLNKPTDQTGLDLLGARYYDPSTMSFLGVDPLVETTRSPYLYANGDPVNLADPNGTAPCARGRTCEVYVLDDLGTVSAPPDSWTESGPWRSGRYRDEILAASNEFDVNWNLLASVIDYESTTTDNCCFGSDLLNTALDGVKAEVNGGSTTLGVGQLNLAAVEGATQAFPEFLRGRTEGDNITPFTAEDLWKESRHDGGLSIRLAAANISNAEADVRGALAATGVTVSTSPPPPGAKVKVIRLSSLVAQRYNVSLENVIRPFDNGRFNPMLAHPRLQDYGLLATRRINERSRAN
jgi:RHS repeat-associated protein